MEAVDFKREEKGLDMMSYIVHEGDSHDIPVHLASIPPSTHGPLISVRNNKGLFFTRALPANTLVFAERAFLLSDLEFIEPDSAYAVSYNARPTWNLVEKCLLTKSNDEIRRFIATGYAYGLGDLRGPHWEVGADDVILRCLADRFPEDGLDKIAHLYDLVSTNNTLATRQHIKMGEGVLIETAAQHGMFLCLSRVNHACNPTIRFEVPMHDPVDHDPIIRVYTTRPVAVGDELTFDYLDKYQRTMTKREALEELFDFRCACLTCQKLCSLLSCSGRGILQCRGCHRALYCSADHAKLDWRRHWKQECINIQKKQRLLDILHK